jgi:hypothetical protein
MPELPESLHPVPASPDPEDETPTGPAVIDPERFEDFPVFRETFLSFVPAAGVNVILRSFGEMLYRFVLEYWQYWPDQPEGQLRGSLRAAVADMRHVQGFLLDWAHPETSYSGAHEAHLGKVGGEIAVEIGELADRLEKELGTWRG